MDFVPAPMGTDAILTIHLYLEIRACFSLLNIFLFSSDFSGHVGARGTSFFHTFRRPTRMFPPRLGLSTSKTTLYRHILPATEWRRFSPSHSLLQRVLPVQLPESRRSTAAPPSPFSRLRFPAAVPRPPPQSRRLASAARRPPPIRYRSCTTPQIVPPIVSSVRL
jgi:hypothetical protein